MLTKNQHPLPLNNIHITDPLFSHYIKTISETAMPYQWQVLNDAIEGIERSHCLENFRIAAGDKTGTHYGVVFQDSDAYKWLEAVSYCIENGSGEQFEKTADSLIDLISRAQQADGYLNTYYTIKFKDQRWLNLLEGHELYCAGHLIEAAVAYFKATGKRVLLETACRFADLIHETFGPDQSQHKGYPGHQEIELALIKLFRITGEKKYLQTAKHFIDKRGGKDNYFLEEIAKREDLGLFPEFKDYDLKYSQAHIPPLQQRSIEGHAVRAMYMCCAMADLAMEYNDNDLLVACKALWESTTQKKMYITGSIGSSGHLERFTVDYDLPNNSNYSETCASVGLMMFGQRMAAQTGEASYYDIVERALYNTVLAGISSDGRQYFYVNPLELWPENCQASTSMSHIKPVRQDWFSVACCPTNIARTLASLGQYIYATDDDSLYVNQLISSRIVSEGPGSIGLELNSDLYKAGKVQIKADSAIKLKIRIPSYLSQVKYQINGKHVIPKISGGYACFELSEMGMIEIQCTVVPTWVSANENVRADIAKSALVYGPFVYCIEEMDNFKNLSAIFIDQNTQTQSSEELTDLPGEMPFLDYQGYKIRNRNKELFGVPDYSIEPVNLKAVPYCLWCNRTPGEMLVWHKVHLKKSNIQQDLLK